ncbi:multiple sugar transport system substrate-binding protein [Enterococcus sp. AZ194]|uniref:ABC transporter substrate-binding protein n=1 Tax=Enterococcus sp. AZ194 TaxID=2774629 RepID=UPI003F243832
MNRTIKNVTTLLIGLLALTVLGACGGGQQKKDGTASGETTLKFQIWDTNQKAGMEKMAEAFTKENPKIKVEVEVTPWDQYWTKLQAAATGGNMADIFWMHPDQVYTFEEGGAMLDLTDKIKDSAIDMSKFPEYITSGYNIGDKQYAIPKDFSTIGLWYNKDLFDAAGVSYPDDTWTWDTWMDAAKKLTNKEKGIYGMLAPANGQNFWYNLVWQNGSDLISKDGKKTMLGDPKTVEALKYGVSFIEKGYSPTTADFANTTADQYFESGKAAMVTSGSWMANEYLSIDGLHADVAPMPKGTQRGSVSSGMGYAIAANTKHEDEAWKFLQFLAGDEANKIQSKSGAAISALEGTQQPWVDSLPDINAKVFVDAADYGYSSMSTPSRAAWVETEQEYANQIFSLSIDVEKGCQEMAQKAQSEIDDYFAQ